MLSLILLLLIYCYLNLFELNEVTVVIKSARGHIFFLLWFQRLRCYRDVNVKATSNKVATRQLYISKSSDRHMWQRVCAVNTLEDKRQQQMERKEFWSLSVCAGRWGQSICLKRHNTKIGIKITLVFLLRTNHMLLCYFSVKESYVGEKVE